MKQFSQNFKNYKFFFAALAVRLFLVPLAFHSDLTTNSIWGTYAKEFGLRGYYDWLNFGNYARPEYPPLSTILFLSIRYLYEVVFVLFWKINISIPVFPSGFITWLDKYGYMTLLKLPGIFADLGIGILIYKITKKRVYSYFYLFNPAAIYLSSVWGQTEPFVGFFALLGLLLLLDKKYVPSFWIVFVSFMTKAAMFPLALVMLTTAIKEKIRLKEILLVLLSLVTGLFVLGYLFTDHAFITWSAASYVTKFITGAHNLEYINLNAFNFWGLMLGFARISDKPFLPLAWGISSVFFIFVTYKLWKGGNIFFASLLIFYASFLFLPRMHERYLYPVFIFFPLVLAKFPKLKKIFYLISFVFLVNLYHWWWVPYIPPLVALFGLELVARGLSFLNLASFGYLLWKYQLS